jgi:hypothetical protein
MNYIVAVYEGPWGECFTAIDAVQTYIMLTGMAPVSNSQISKQLPSTGSAQGLCIPHSVGKLLPALSLSPPYNLMSASQWQYSRKYDPPPLIMFTNYTAEKESECDFYWGLEQGV